MSVVIAAVVGALFAAGIYLMMRRSIVKLLIGLALSGYSTNLLLFITGGLTRGRSPIVPAGHEALVPPHADPLPQALVLTSIVIGFGVLSFAAALVQRAVRTLGTDDLDDMRSTDR